MKFFSIFLILLFLIFIVGCSQKQDIQFPDENKIIKEQPIQQPIDRESKIPSDAVKITPQTDESPPKSYSTEYSDPVPLSSTINTAGAEDSPFFSTDTNELYFFFTPDVRIPVEKQVIDKVTGIHVSKKSNNEWQKPERVLLQDLNKAGSDGCEFVKGNKMLFCSVREGYTGIHWFSADFENEKWQRVSLTDFKPEYKVGELHIFNDELYFHSDRSGTKGDLDIWMSKKINNEWSEPTNLENVNSASSEGWPALNLAGNELWFSKDYGIWRSKKLNGEWQKPELMFSPLAGEPTIDNQGNVYFVHHFFKDNKMLEADIYVAYKK